jgi:MFS family permease
VGLAWSEIGIVFTIMLVPFVLIQYPAGLLADKKYGEKEMLFIGVVIMIIALVFMLFVHTDSFVFWAVVLFASRVGAALFEAMQDSYFYKQINENDISIINFFRSTRAVAYIISAATVGVMLGVTTDLRGVFVILICVMIIGLYPIIVLKDTVPYNNT